MKKNVLISVKSKQSTDEKGVEVVTPGEYYKEDDVFYAVYEETELSGMKGTTTTLKISDNEVNLIRKGTTCANMKFNKQMQDISLYDTPYGALQIRVDTKKINIDVNENGADVSIDYDITIEGQEKIGTNLSINIKK